MSLFKSLVKNIVRKGLEEVASQLEEKSAGLTKRATVEEEPVQPIQDFDPDEKSLYTFGGTEEAYFESIFDQYFEEYAIETRVEAQTFDVYAHQACVPIDYLFYKEGEPVLAILLVKPNSYKGMQIKGTLDVCDKAGIPWLRFFRTWKNEENYVVERIRKHLN